MRRSISIALMVIPFILAIGVLLYLEKTEQKVMASDKRQFHKEEQIYLDSIKDLTITFGYNHEAGLAFSQPIIHILRHELGLTIKPVQEQDWKALLSGGEAGSYDLITSMTYTHERGEQFTLSSRIFDEYRIGITHRDNPVFNINDLRNARVGFLRGSVYEHYSEVVLTEETQVFYFDSVIEALEALENQDIDLVIDGEYTKALVVDREQLQIQFVFQDKPHPLCIGTANDKFRPLIHILNRILEEDHDHRIAKQVKSAFHEHVIDKMKRHLAKKFPDLSEHIKQVKVVIPLHYFPYSYEYEGEVHGVDIDGLRLFEQLTGIEIDREVVRLEDDVVEGFKRLNNNEVQVILGKSRYPGELYTSNIVKSAGLKQSSNRVSMIRADREDSFVRKPNLTFGITTNLLDYAKFNLGDEHYIEFDNYSDAFEALKQGDIDILIGAQAVIDYMKNIRNDTTIKQSPLIEIPYEHTLLLNQHNTMLNELTNEVIRYYLILYAPAGSMEWKSKINDYESAYVRLQQQQQQRSQLMVIGAFTMIILLFALFMYKHMEKNKRLLLEHRKDRLTGLLSRNYYEDACLELLDTHQRDYNVFVFLDLDHFKSINDTYGHAFGDEYLQAFAQSLQSYESSTAIAFRIAGDEFGLLLVGYQTVEEAVAAGEAIGNRPLVEIDLPNGQSKIPIKYSVGYSIYNEDTQDFATLKAYADFAMYQAKANKSVPIKVKRFRMEEYSTHPKRK